MIRKYLINNVYKINKKPIEYRFYEIFKLKI